MPLDDAGLRREAPHNRPVLSRSDLREAAFPRSAWPALHRSERLSIEQSAWALRNIDALRSASSKHGENVEAFVARLLEGPLPWTRMRQAYRLMRLCERCGAPRLDALCARALAFDVIDTRRIERMLKAAQRAESEVESTGKLIALPSRFARDAASFKTAVLNLSGESKEEDGGAE